MFRKWSIFRILNLVEIISISAVIGYGFYKNRDLEYSSDDAILLLVILFSVPLITFINGVNNIYLLSYLKANHFMSTIKKVAFWIFGILFLITCLLMLTPIVKLLLDINSTSIEVSTNAKAASNIFLLVFFMVWVLNGLCIVIMQFMLYRKIRKDLLARSLEQVDKLGHYLVSGTDS